MTDPSNLEDLRAELADPLPHADPHAMRTLGDQVLGWVMHHFSTLGEQAIGRTATREEMEALLREPPPERGEEFARAFADFQEKVAPFAFRVNHPRFLAFVPGAPTFVSVLGDLLCAGTNFFAGVWLEAAGPAEVELVVLDWFRTFLGYPPGARGILTSGGSEANLTALLVARERLTFEERARTVLYLTEQRHGSIDRAARVMGLRREQLRPVPAGDGFVLQAVDVAAAIARDREAGRLPLAVVANAGATNTGSVDPLAELARVCRQEHVWLHVDAAYGWPAVLTPEGRAVLDGIGEADSVTLDPHKWFGQTFDVGCVLVRDGHGLAATFGMRPDYLQDVEPGGDEVNFADHGLALTRRFRALKIWLSVKVLGVGWFRALVARSCRLAELAQRLLERAGVFEILSPRQLSIVCFRYRPGGQGAGAADDEALDRLNLALADELRASGRAFLSSTRLHGRVALRFCFVNWRTTAADVDEVVDLLCAIGRRLADSKRGLTP